MSDEERAGVRHMRVLARRPRPAGSREEHEARLYCEQVLADAGFTIHEESFEYSSFPGRFATPVAGALLCATVVVAAWCALQATTAWWAGLALGAGAVMTGLFARRMFAGVLDFPWMRCAGVNVMAVRGTEPPRVWLVAHLDSKSQPVPSLARVCGVLLLAAGVLGAVLADVLTLLGHDARTLWWGALVAAVVGALPVMASLVGNASDGAVDNASGVAAVLDAAAKLRTNGCGVLLTSAEELGLAGARAWTRAHPAALMLNCDGVDDDGAVVLMFNGHFPTRIADAVRDAAREDTRGDVHQVSVRRMPLGLLTDSSAFAAQGWESATVSHGSLRTLRRIHTSRDSLEQLRGAGIDKVANLLVCSVEVLA